MGRTRESFNTDVFLLRPLLRYVDEVAPHITQGVCEIDVDGAAELAEILTVELESGRTAECAATVDAKADAMPDERCRSCLGGGRPSAWSVAVRGTDPDGPCDECNASGVCRPLLSKYRLSVECVAEFRDWVAAGAEFSIYI